ncbi:unnamed protein product [Microthlaspi erraticum]|uniref:Uncharacterized protein n=1 Tax=Microthlaspi erraticum TaxID=1685480 RepID=A0A6D2I7L3_9BRAS|nr:unnamed protein product [Microthlaspi erraticum]
MAHLQPVTCVKTSYYPDQRCALWDCLRYKQPGFIYCSQAHMVAATAESQLLKPVCMTNMFTVAQIEQLNISHLFDLVRMQAPQRNTGLPNFRHNLYILSLPT